MTFPLGALFHLASWRLRLMRHQHLVTCHTNGGMAEDRRVSKTQCLEVTQIGSDTWHWHSQTISQNWSHEPPKRRTGDKREFGQ
jgi:hypothetical protein